ncbi:hypothetical protein C7U92_09690 [Bradyrhizobium sp. WBOS7]|uniref:Uncharacterized protein n=2 Tax=Nitrobacteraceae TaxID=41294 RepID=A0AAE9NEM4_9BRAD|nr:hypothetical protein [Bradyrhizobium sp. WBOS2]MDD1570385.1 hypothetical protein [Bradyrhizobium sp. WBOS1]MDD1577005.1 hypothetical protein [Bradyrhizobium sp. WBOS7]MDD1599316.1 hypothetical protein [Bradyrhizobium sp. WBOS16]UUO36487.1 hypothetical protein DCK84_19255 [Bradyrhizobium sp. WBOS01]UUO42791.1 hypothetical protein DCM75_20010 [Bradyrhizobium sp. WBOS02]UUO54255.1 hypothetical protein DCM79_15500 [Bradyrhizobium sp. WBOS07]UUO68260.1 hypothetical protein DCM83_25610 [Bradyrh
MPRAIVVLLAVLLAAHAPMLLNDGLFMDDWLVLKPRPDYFIDIDFLLNGAGHPIFYSYDRFANWTGAPVAVMVSLAFAGIVFGATSLALTARRLGLLDRAEAVGFALSVWTYPGYQLWAGKANAVYVFSFGLLFVGAWLLTLAFSARGPRRVLLRLACALAFLLGFALNSTIVLFAFVMLGLFVAIWRGGNAADGFVRRSWLAGWRCAAGYPELIALPLIYWGTLNIWFKRMGVYAQHYDAHFPTLGELARGWWAFFVAGYRDVMANAVRAAITIPTLFIAAAVLAGIVVLLLRSDTKPAASRLAIFLPLMLAVMLFLALASPYLIAGLRPSSMHFYESRHLLMFGVPSALALLAVKRLVERWTSPRLAFAAVFGAGLIVSIGMLWTNYIFMQARTLKQEALARDLAGRAQPAATVYALDDGFFDYPSRHVPFGLAEVTGMLRLAWGNQPFFGFALRAERPDILRSMDEARKAPGSAFHHFDPSGPQATISFQPGPGAAPNPVLVRKYYACRLLARCDVPEFLAQLAQVTIKLGPIPGILPIEKNAAPEAR